MLPIDEVAAIGKTSTISNHNINKKLRVLRGRLMIWWNRKSNHFHLIRLQIVIYFFYLIFGWYWNWTCNFLSFPLINEWLPRSRNESEPSMLLNFFLFSLAFWISISSRPMKAKQHCLQVCFTRGDFHPLEFPWARAATCLLLNDLLVIPSIFSSVQFSRTISNSWYSQMRWYQCDSPLRMES